MVVVQNTKIVVVIGSILHEEEQIIRNLAFFVKHFNVQDKQFSYSMELYSKGSNYNSWSCGSECIQWRA